jgi:hypothetical protein
MRKAMISMLLVWGLAIVPQTANAAPACSARQQVDKCASQCRFCTEGNHGAACFAGWWNAWLKPSYAKAKWMLAKGSFSQGHNTALLSQVIEGVAEKQKVAIKDIKDDDVMKYGNETVGSALGTVSHALDSLGIKDNNMKIQCYQWCDRIDPVTYRNITDPNLARAATQLDAGACRNDGPGAWNPEWAKQALRTLR